MALSNDIEDQFASAVKSALDACGPVSPPPEAATVSMRTGRPRRSRVWAITLLCVAFAAITAVVVAAALRIGRGNARRVRAELGAMWPSGAFDQPNAAILAHQSTEPSAAAPRESTTGSSSTTTAVPVAPTAALSGSTAAMPSSASTPAASGISPAAEASKAAAPGLTVETSGAPALTTSSANETQQLLATPSALSRGTQVSRRMRQAANKSKEISVLAQTDHRPIAAVAAPAHSLETGLTASSAKAQPTPPERVSSVSQAGSVEHLASAGSPPLANAASAANASEDPARIGGAAIIGRPVSESRIPIAAVILPAARAKAESAKASAVSAAVARSILVSSPDHSVYWALEGSGTIFRSTDRTSWQKQHSGVKSDLLAGQAPSNNVCWVVGRDGTILLTIDGTQWQRIKSPTTTDLVNVSASGADVADIVAADGLRFSTFDRGSNWQPIN